MRGMSLKRDRPFPSCFFLSVSKRVLGHNVSYGNYLICKITCKRNSHLNMKGWAPRLVLKETFLSKIERKYCLIRTSYLAGLFDIFISLHIWHSCVCFGDFLPMRTLCDAYHKEFESHKRSVLDLLRNDLSMSLTRFPALASIADYIVVPRIRKMVHSEQTPQRTNRFIQLPFWIVLDD